MLISEASVEVIVSSEPASPPALLTPELLQPLPYETTRACAKGYNLLGIQHLTFLANERSPRASTFKLLGYVALAPNTPTGCRLLEGKVWNKKMATENKLK